MMYCKCQQDALRLETLIRHLRAAVSAEREDRNLEILPLLMSITASHRGAEITRHIHANAADLFAHSLCGVFG